MKLGLFLWFLVFLSAPAGATDDPLAYGEHPGRTRGPEETLRGIFQPWSGPLAELGRTLDDNRSYIVWIKIPPLYPLDLRTGEFLRRWFKATPAQDIHFGHNMVAWRCQASDGRWSIGATGKTGAGSKQHKRMFLNGFGLSSFLSTYHDGVLESQGEVSAYLQKNLRKRGAAATAFEVTPRQCARMLSFLVKYARHPSRPYGTYAFHKNPEKFEGGNCANFAAAMLKSGSVFPASTREVQRKVTAPRALLGGNLPNPPHVEPPPLPWLQGRSHSVTIRDLLNSPWQGGPSASLEVMDPELMLFAKKQVATAYLETLPAQQRAQEARWLGATHFGTRIVRSFDGHTLSHYPINGAFDPKTSRIGHQSLRWFRGKLKDGHRIRRAAAGGIPVLILERSR